MNGCIHSGIASTGENRWFPLELHTFLPVLHWLPRRWHRRLLARLGMTFWAEEANLNLLGARDLRSLFPDGAGVPACTVTGSLA